MKYDISWHQECLKNRKKNSANQRADVMSRIAQCDRLDEENAFYERQIAEAQRRKMTAFDRDKLLKSKKS